MPKTKLNLIYCMQISAALTFYKYNKLNSKLTNTPSNPRPVTVTYACLAHLALHASTES